MPENLYLFYPQNVFPQQTAGTFLNLSKGAQFCIISKLLSWSGAFDIRLQIKNI